MMHEEKRDRTVYMEITKYQKEFLSSVKACQVCCCCFEGCSCPSRDSWLRGFFAIIGTLAQPADLAEH